MKTSARAMCRTWSIPAAVWSTAAGSLSPTQCPTTPPPLRRCRLTTSSPRWNSRTPHADLTCGWSTVHPQKLLLIDDFHAEPLGIVEFGAAVFAGEHIIGVLAHAVGHRKCQDWRTPRRGRPRGSFGVLDNLE